MNRRNFLIQSTATAIASAVSLAPTDASASSSNKRKLKIGQIGVGHTHAEGKMKVLRESPDWEVVGVVEEDPQLLQTAQQSPVYRGVPWMTEEQLLNAPGLDAVAVETTVDRLMEVAERCISAGKHIHLDKPPGDSAERLQALLSEANKCQLTVQMGYMYRYNPAIKLLHELHQQGCLGEIFEINAVMSKQIDDDKRQQWAKLPGGTMLELGSHLIDLLIRLMGKPEQVIHYNSHSGSHNDDLLDNMLAVCIYPKCAATIRSTGLEVAGSQRRHLVVCGTEGTVHIQPLDSPSVQLALSKPYGEFSKGYQTISVKKYIRYVDDVADLASIVRGEKSADFDTTHDVTTHETLLRACGVL